MLKKILLKSMCSKKIFTLTAFLLLTFLLNACGFQWQQKETIPTQLHNLYLQSESPYDQFTITLKRNLIANGINVIPQATKKAYILEIISMNCSHTGANIYSSAQASIYNFIFTTKLKITNQDGKVIFGPEAISASRNLTLNPNEVLAASNQVDTIEQEMRNEVVRKILNRLRSKQVSQAVQIKI